MDANAVKTNLNTLKEAILDEQKLLTYVTISRELCIHVNDSKFLLSRLVEVIRKERPDVDLNVSYIISGLLENNKARTTVILEKELENLHKEFKIIFFQHIYSVSKGVSSVDNVAFLAINKFEDFPLCTGLIKNSFCIKHTSDEIENLKSKSQVASSVEQKPALSNKSLKTSVKNNSYDESDKSVTKIQETKSEPVIKTEIPSPSKDLHSKSIQKSDIKKNGIKSQKGIAGFFNKSNSAPSKNLVKDVIEKKDQVIIKTEKKSAENILVKVDEVNDNEDATKLNNKVETRTNTVKDKTKNNSLSKIKKNAKVDKKRKRVLHVSDSENEDENNDPFEDNEPAVSQESEDEIPPTPSINTVKITSGITNPKKRRKIVDKTYTDDEGYILTKKVEVYESCSDNEEEQHTKENVQVTPVNQMEQQLPKENKKEIKNSKKKISPPQKGKQATLMTFFKKV